MQGDFALIKPLRLIKPLALITPLPFVFLILLMHSVRHGPLHTVGGVDQHVIDLEVRLWISLNRNPFLKGVFLIRMPYKFAQKRSCVRVPPQTEFLRINKPPRCPCATNIKKD